VRVALSMAVVRVGRNELVEPRDQIDADIRVGVLIDDQPRRRVRRVDVADAIVDVHFAHRSGHALRDIEQFLIVAGADVDAPGQGGPPLRRDYNVLGTWTERAIILWINARTSRATIQVIDEL